MLFYVFIGLLMIFCGLVGFYDFIEDYENSLPHHKIEEFISSADGGELLIGDSDFKISEFETPEEVAECVYFPDEKPQLSYKRAGGEYTDTAPVYVIYDKGRNIAKVSLKKGENTSEHGFPVWEIGKTDSLLGQVKTYKAKIFVPEGMIPKINGIDVSDSYKAPSKGEIKDLKSAYNYIEALPGLAEYNVDGLYREPKITALDRDGNEVLPEIKGNSYYFRPADSEALKSAHEEMLIAMERAYISYMINEFKETDVNFARLSAYLMPGSPAYSMLRNLSVEWNNPYDTREDILISAEHFTPYSEDCFSANTVFKIKLKRYRVENEYNGNIRWTFVKKDGQWKAVQMEFEAE